MVLGDKLIKLKVSIFLLIKFSLTGHTCTPGKPWPILELGERLCKKSTKIIKTAGKLEHRDPR